MKDRNLWFPLHLDNVKALKKLPADTFKDLIVNQCAGYMLECLETAGEDQNIDDVIESVEKKYNIDDPAEDVAFSTLKTEIDRSVKRIISQKQGGYYGAEQKKERKKVTKG